MSYIVETLTENGWQAHTEQGWQSAYPGADIGPLVIFTSDTDAERFRDELCALVGMDIEAFRLVPLVHAFDFRGQARCGSGTDTDHDAPASHDPAEVTCPNCRQ